jgi:hypothetical protein
MLDRLFSINAQIQVIDDALGSRLDLDPDDLELLQRWKRELLLERGDLQRTQWGA